MPLQIKVNSVRHLKALNSLKAYLAKRGMVALLHIKKLIWIVSILLQRQAIVLLHVTVAV